MYRTDNNGVGVDFTVQSGTQPGWVHLCTKCGTSPTPALGVEDNNIHSDSPFKIHF